MALFQYKVRDYGKVLFDEDVEQRRKFLAFLYKKSNPEVSQYEATNLYPHVFYKKISGPDSWTSPAVQKYILFEIDRTIIGHAKYTSLNETYIKVLTQNPTDTSDRPQQLRFWVREDWVEPLRGKETYQEDICLRLLKKLKDK